MMVKLNYENDELLQYFTRYSPWITKYIINNKSYGGNYDAMNDIRIKYFFEYFDSTATILELGSLEGGHSFALAQHPGVNHIVAIEGRKENIEKSLFVQKVLNIKNVEFIEADLEQIDFSKWNPFDAAFCVGILYHLPNPWHLLKQVSLITQKLFIWTHYTKFANITINNYEGIWYSEKGIKDPLSGLSTSSFWPTYQSLIQMLKDSGYNKITIIENQEDHPHGPAITLAVESQ